jgi:branched-chain amino acid transport system permease protein
MHVAVSLTLYYATITPAQIVEMLFNGLSLGMLYVLLALGLNIILGLMGVINFAHGALFTLGAYVTFALATRVGLFPAIVAAGLCMALLGMAGEALFIRRLYGRPPEHILMFTFGAFLIITQVIRKIWGDDPQPLSLPPALSGTVNLGFTDYPSYRLLVVVLTMVVLALVYLMLVRTNLGLTIRAGTRDSGMVNILGINMPATFTLVFGIGSFLGGLAGGLEAPLHVIDPNLGAGFIITAFMVVIVGGIGSFWGAIVGGLVIGVLQEATVELIPGGSSAVDIVPFAFMLLILLVRPRGLFGTAGLFD